MSKSKIYRENGYYFNAKTGEQYLWQDDSTVTRRAIRHGEKNPTFGYKLRRFLRRLVNTANAKLVELQTYPYPHLYPEQSLSAAEVPFIGLEE